MNQFFDSFLVLLCPFLKLESFCTHSMYIADFKKCLLLSSNIRKNFKWVWNDTSKGLFFGELFLTWREKCENINVFIVPASVGVTILFVLFLVIFGTSLWLMKQGGV